MAHSAVPWIHEIAGCNHWIRSADGRRVAFIGGGDTLFTITPGTDHDADADLFIAAVNACAAVNPANPVAAAEALPKLVAFVRQVKVCCILAANEPGAIDYNLMKEDAVKALAAIEKASP